MEEGRGALLQYEPCYWGEEMHRSLLHDFLFVFGFECVVPASWAVRLKKLSWERRNGLSAGQDDFRG